MNSDKYLLSCALAVALTLTAVLPQSVAAQSTQPATSPAASTVVAEVNGERLTQDEFWRLCESALRVSPNAGTVGMQVLADWIQTALRAQDARRLQVHPTEAEVDERMAAVKRSAGSEKAFAESLRRQGLTPEILRRNLKEALVNERLLYRGVTVSDAELAAEFERGKARLVIPERLEFSQMTLESPQKLAAARKQLAEGKAFGEVATAHSSDPFAKLGGKVPFPIGVAVAAGGPIAKETVAAASKLKEGQVSEPVRLGTTWVLVRLEKRHPAVQPSLEDHRDGLRSALLNRKAQSAGILRQNQAGLNESILKAEIKVHRPEYTELVTLLKNAASGTVRQ